MHVIDKTKVLVVDDEPDVFFLFSRILSKRKLRTDYAHNLAEAASYIQNDPPDLIFLDNYLPDGQGVDFIPYVKANFPHIRVVMVTANDSLIDKKRAFQQGADDFLGKPMSLEQINRTLDQINELNGIV